MRRCVPLLARLLSAFLVLITASLGLSLAGLGTSAQGVATEFGASVAASAVVPKPPANAHTAKITKLTDASKTGRWTSPIALPLVPTAAALLPGNRVLVWSAWSPTTYLVGPHGQTDTAIIDLNTNTVSEHLITNTHHDMFCPGVAILPDGRIMVAGGDDASATSIFDPATSTWSSGPSLIVPRGYQGQALLPDGNIFMIGGSFNGGVGGKLGELWNLDGSGHTLSGVPVTPIETKDPRGEYRADNHAWLFPLSGGRLLQAGPSQTMHWITTAGDGTITSAGKRGTSADAMNGNAVYYDIDKLLTMGGAPAYENSKATGRTYVVDLTGSKPKVTRSGDLAQPRAFGNSVVLPDGKVLTIGGQATPVPFSDKDAALRPELWNPATGKYAGMSPLTVPRDYHSWAILLPDGRVISGGGGLCGACATNHPNAQIFTPPYLLNADETLKQRPVLNSAPAAATRGTTIDVTATAGLTKFALIRYGEATHSLDNDQRRVPLKVASATGSSYQLALPADPGVLVSGPYMLFAVDAKGVPSVSKPVTIS